LTETRKLAAYDHMALAAIFGPQLASLCNIQTGALVLSTSGTVAGRVFHTGAHARPLAAVARERPEPGVAGVRPAEAAARERPAEAAARERPAEAARG